MSAAGGASTMMRGRDPDSTRAVIPLRVDDAPPRAPVVLALVALNLLVFAALAADGPAAEAAVRAHGFVPARLSSAESWRLLGPLAQLGPLVAHAFLHQGALHLAGNLCGLWVFGAAVEARIGARAALAIYLGALLAAAAAHGLAAPGSVSPMIGASGGVAGLMGACLVLRPGGRVLVVFPIPFPTTARLPVAALVGAWLMVQLWQAATAGPASGVAWWAHVGGFCAGAACALARRLPAWWPPRVASRPIAIGRRRMMARSAR